MRFKFNYDVHFRLKWSGCKCSRPKEEKNETKEGKRGMTSVVSKCTGAQAHTSSFQESLSLASTQGEGKLVHDKLAMHAKLVVSAVAAAAAVVAMKTTPFSIEAAYIWSLPDLRSVLLVPESIYWF